MSRALQELMAGAAWRPGAPGHDGLPPPAPLQPQLSIPYLMQHARLCAQGLSPGADCSYATGDGLSHVLLSFTTKK